MTGTTATPLSPQEARALHERLLARSRVAATDLAVAYLDRLAIWLARHNPNLDPHACDTAAEDAILALIKNPHSYKPESMDLERYLRMSAQGDLKNLLRAERRHSRRRVALEAVELSPGLGKYLRDEDADPARVAERRDEAGEASAVALRPILARVRTGLTLEEVKVLDLMQQGVKDTRVYAAALGITDRPFQEQQTAVKRVKDKIMQRIKRAGGRHARPH